MICYGESHLHTKLKLRSYFAMIVPGLIPDVLLIVGTNWTPENDQARALFEMPAWNLKAALSFCNS
jgi:hypothetical protein